MHKSPAQPLCRYCGAMIRKHSIIVHIKTEPSDYHRAHEGWSRYIYRAEPIKSMAECRALTNHQVLTVKWDRDNGTSANDYKRQPENDQIASFTEWDGESYVDLFFCNGDHAKRFAYVMAKAGHQTQASADANRAQKERA